MSNLKIYLYLSAFLLNSASTLAQVYEAWVSRYDAGISDAAVAIEADSSGNVYVTGFTYDMSNHYDYLTIKYSANGDTLWTRRYNGPGNNVDQSFDLAVDKDGNVYVTGQSRNNNDYDYATIKYSPTGEILWTKRYDGSVNSEDHAQALTVDDSGNVYVTGRSQGIDPDEDYTTIKYSSSGDTIWIRRYKPSDGLFARASALMVDDDGNVYVTGYSVFIGNSDDYVTVKYSSTGDTLWARRYSGPGNSGDRANALAVDDSGNVYVTGGPVTIKYLPNGDTAWIRAQFGIAIAVDTSRNVYVTSGFGYTTIKYAPNGETLWVRQYSGLESYYSSALAVDDSGNVYVTGYSWNGTSYDYTTIKYSSMGDSLWVKLYNGTGDSTDGAFDLAVDKNGNVYVTGQSGGNGTGSDFVTIKYSHGECSVVAGDATGDAKVNLSDIIFKVNYAFKGGTPPEPFCSGDDNIDTKVDLGDIIYGVNYVFKGGPPPKKSSPCCL